MVALPQTYLTGKGIPKTLDWRLYATHKEVSDALGRLPSTSTPPAIAGLAIHIKKKGNLEFVALAISNKIFVFKAGAEKDPILGDFLRDGLRHIVGYDMAQLALYIKATIGYDVRGYNLPIVLLPEGNEYPGSAVRNLLDPDAKSFDIGQLWDFQREEIEGGSRTMEFLCLRAWISLRLASHNSWSSLISSTKAAETNRLKDQETACLFRMMKERDLIDAEKSRTLQNDFSSVKREKDGSFVIHNERYKSRVRQSGKTKVVFENANGKEYEGNAKGVKGKKTYVEQIGAKSIGTIKKVTVIGLEELTNSEKARNTFILQLLQGNVTLRDPLYPFIAYLWFPEGKRINCKRIQNARVRSGQGDRLLNQSQANVVEAMLNPHRPFVVTHGPPGTGKTTTISVAMREVLSKGTAWVVAQSNVGVKNIAESLCKHSVSFKLLVSKEFYLEWHEHIYAEVESHLVRMDELPKAPRDLEILFYGTRIVLCTLSTLSNPSLQDKNMFRLVPLDMLVVDEASQIGVLEYLHIFGMFKELKKVCFFGDPKQLPPYGKDAASGLQSIFEIAHLKSSAYFLDTQYRMPVEVGNFISKAVYTSKLKSVHEVKGSSCVRFVDVWNGSEEKAGKSWKNMREVQTIVHLVRHYYKGKDYTIITPYDAQRNAIQKALKQERLSWENAFNVDSFQGNEAPYVLISVVRTTGPGFLKSQNRVNVMLTRCKAGMVLVTNRAFTRHDSVRKTLLGKLVEHWENKAGKSNAWCKWAEVAEKKADLPGASGRK